MPESEQHIYAYVGQALADCVDEPRSEIRLHIDVVENSIGLTGEYLRKSGAPADLDVRKLDQLRHQGDPAALPEIASVRHCSVDAGGFYPDAGRAVPDKTDGCFPGAMMGWLIGPAIKPSFS